MEQLFTKDTFFFFGAVLCYVDNQILKILLISFFDHLDLEHYLITTLPEEDCSKLCTLFMVIILTVAL